MTEEQNKLAEEEPEAMKWFRKGRESVLRKNQSGCCCLFNEEDEIVSVCAAHEEWAALREPATDAVRWRKCVQDGEFPICRDGIWMHVDRVTGKILTGGSPEEVIDAATDRALKGKGASQGADFVRVPREPTPAMLDALEQGPALLRDSESWQDYQRRQWAMVLVAASPDEQKG